MEKYYCKEMDCNNEISSKSKSGFCKPCSMKFAWRNNSVFKEKKNNSFIDIQCKNCKIIFKDRKYKNKFFCSLSCSISFKNKNRTGFKDIEIYCSCCGKFFTILKCEFDKHNKRGLDKFYCSRECSSKDKIGSRRINTSNSLVSYYMNNNVKKLNYKNGGFREDIEIYVRSGWEANYIRILNFLKIKWEYEPKIFVLTIDNKNVTYRPDFYLPEKGLWIEIKGFWYTPLSKLKFEKFSNLFNIELIDLKKYKNLAMEYQNKIQNWEGRKYANADYL